jgi:S1-C subfamily serine protease
VAHGVIVTNNHVINGCGRLSVNGVVAKVLGSDARTDLALLNSSLSGQNTNLRARRVSVGEPVAVAGYPLRGLLSGFNMTTGNLSSLSGIGGDTRLVQITAPVQPGNSGGPVLDSAGNLIGVVVSKLDAVRAAKITGDIPQNVNFAINANVLRSFLDANSVEYETASTDKALLPTAIADRAKGFTVLVECWK